MFFDTGRLLAN